MNHRQRALFYPAACFLLALLTLVVYWAVLFPTGEARYPWGSDTLGHVLKTDYLRTQLRPDQPYPDLLPGWYMGVQMLRYYPPLPYYLLAGIAQLSGDTLSAANWLLALSAWCGAVGVLAFARWTGRWPALAGGVLFLVLPDNVRVAFAEGNLPRAVATAALPLITAALFRCIERPQARWPFVGVVLGMAAVTLCHAMMAAIYAACLGALAIGLAFAGNGTIRAALRAVGALALGLLLSGWWLLPSLTGGITNLNAAAVADALTTIPITQHLDPLLRLRDPEAPYTGLALIALAAGLLIYRTGRTPQMVVLGGLGLAAILISTPQLSAVWSALPFHQLLWPLRFLGIASLLLLLAVLWRVQTLGVWRGGLVLGLLLLDGLGSLGLIRLAAPNPDVAAISAQLGNGGWRVATLDESRLGSQASYAFAAHNREQVFGWAYQGAHTAPTVAALNGALAQGQLSFLLDRLDRYGVDSVVLLHTLPNAPAVADALAVRGFTRQHTGQTADLWQRNGGPRAQLDHCPALAIGRGAPTYASLFPSVCVGSSPFLDDYSVAELSRYQTVALAGFRWRDQATAEARIQQVAANGTRVVVDLVGVPADPLAQAPRFLDVWGEPLTFAAQPLDVQSTDATWTLGALGTPAAPWVAVVPQGLTQTTHGFRYINQPAAALGWRTVGDARVWFLGANIAYHAALTGDLAARTILAEALALPNTPATSTIIPEAPALPNTPGTSTSIPEAPALPNTPTTGESITETAAPAHTSGIGESITETAAPAHTSGIGESIALATYRADSTGYRFSYTLPEAGRLFVPIAALPGMQLRIDGVAATIHSIEQLIAFDAPAGTHQVTLTLEQTPIYTVGIACSFFACGVLLLCARPRRRGAI